MLPFPISLVSLSLSVCLSTPSAAGPSGILLRVGLGGAQGRGKGLVTLLSVGEGGGCQLWAKHHEEWSSRPRSQGEKWFGAICYLKAPRPLRLSNVEHTILVFKVGPRPRGSGGGWSVTNGVTDGPLTSRRLAQIRPPITGIIEHSTAAAEGDDLQRVVWEEATPLFWDHEGVALFRRRSRRRRRRGEREGGGAALKSWRTAGILAELRKAQPPHRPRRRPAAETKASRGKKEGSSRGLAYTSAFFFFGDVPLLCKECIEESAQEGV